MPFCQKCGFKIYEDSEFCQKCGNKVTPKLEKEKDEEPEDTYECEFCGKEFSSEVRCLKHEKTCPEREEEEEDTYECEFCDREFSSEMACLRHEKKCPERDEEDEPEPEKTVVREVHHHEKPSGGGGGGFIKFIIFLVIIGAVIFFIVIAAEEGVFDELLGGGGKIASVVDPCEREFNSCNHACGEGILNSICKEKCSYEYRQCRG